MHELLEAGRDVVERGRVHAEHDERDRRRPPEVELFVRIVVVVVVDVVIVVVVVVVDGVVVIGNGICSGRVGRAAKRR